MQVQVLPQNETVKTISGRNDAGVEARRGMKDSRCLKTKWLRLIVKREQMATNSRRH
jgi:hypothetical protein